MELRHLRYFVAAEAQHFTQAAEQLGMAQPTVAADPPAGSRGWHAAVRPQGPRRAAERCRTRLPDLRRDILQRADAALQTARRAARGEVGELTLGFTSASFNAVVTELIRQYRRATRMWK